MSDHLTRALAWMGPAGQQKNPPPPDLVRKAMMQTPHDVTTALVQYVYADRHINMGTLLKAARAYRTNPLFRWLEKELPPIQ